MIVEQRKSGIYLTCLGVGMGNYKDSKIEALARNGNGNFAYIDDIREAEKVLVTEFTQTLYTVANDVYLDVQFNPAFVKEYRLIGYDNKNIAADTSVELEGGEIGSGNGITAAFEIIPSVYDTSNAGNSNAGIATIKINYHKPDEMLQRQLTYVCAPNFKSLNDICSELRFASAVTMFGLILRQSKYLSGAELSNVSAIAHQAVNPQDYLQNEFLVLVEKAQKLYTKKKKRKSEKNKEEQEN